MNRVLIGILVILMGIWQIYAAQKMYQNIRKTVKHPNGIVFYGVAISMIMGLAFLVIGAVMLGNN